MNYRFTTLLIFLSAALLACGQCTVSRDKIPAAMPIDRRQQVEILYSQDKIARADAAYSLGRWGTNGTDAIPFLINILSDHGKMSDQKMFYWSVPGNPWAHEITSPGREAAKALVRIGSASIDPLLEVIKNDPSLLARINAMYALGEFRELRAVPLITDHKNIWQPEALEALAKIRDPQCIPRLLATFNQSPEFVSTVVNVLVEIGPQSIDPLLAYLQKMTNPNRPMAARALGKLGDSRVIPVLAACLSETDTSMQLEACNALINLSADQEKTEKAIVPLIKHADWRIRQSAAQVLGRFKDVRMLQVLSPLLTDSDVTVRGYAVLAIGTNGGKGAADLIVPLLEDHDLFPRKAAVEALVMLKDSRAIDTLVALAKAGSIATKVDVAILLGRLGNAPAASALAPLTTGSEPSLLEAARKAMLSIGDVAADPYARYLNAQCNAIEWNMLGSGFELLQQMGPAAAIPAAREFMNPASWQYTAKVKPFLPKYGDVIIDTITEGMKGKVENWMLMENATEVLALIDSPRIAAPLITLLNHKDIRVSDFALGGLRRISKETFGKDPAIWQVWADKNSKK